MNNHRALYCLAIQATDSELDMLELYLNYVTEQGNLIVPREWWWLLDEWKVPRVIGGEG